MQINDVTISGLTTSIYYSGLPMATRDWEISDRDFKRADTLAATPMGSGHDNFLNGVVVHFYVKATNKWWTEMQRYHFIDFVSSQSTMHRLTKFDLDDFYNEYVDPRIIEIMKELQQKANEGGKEEQLKLLYSNPAGAQLGAYMVTNYRQLKTIYKQRRNHRLPEWHVFCDWVETLPMAHLITGKVDGEKK